MQTMLINSQKCPIVLRTTKAISSWKNYSTKEPDSFSTSYIFAPLPKTNVLWKKSIFCFIISNGVVR